MKNWKKNLWTLLFVVYMVILLRLTVFRPGFLRQDLMSGWVNVDPWNFYRWMAAIGQWRIIWVNLLGNIAAFIPFGVWLSMRRVPLWRCVLHGLMLTLFIETSQWFFGTGTADFDDVVLNFTGTLLGWIVCQIVMKLSRKEK